MRRKSEISKRPIADAITTAASAVLGSERRTCGAKISRSAIMTALTTAVSCVLAPAASATGVRDELLLIGNP